MIPSATDLDYQQVLRQSPTPFVVLAADPDFTITDMSEAYLQVTMTRKEDILGKGMFEAFPGNPDTPEASGVSQLRASLEAVVTKRVPQTMPVVKYDIRQPDGTFEERYWSAVHSPIIGSNGEVAYILQHTQDVTAIIQLQRQKQEQSHVARQLQIRTNQMEAEVVKRVEELEEAYASLEENEHRYRALADEAIIRQNRFAAAVEASRQMLYDWDPVTNDMIYDGSVFELTGFEPDELQGGLERFIELIHPDDRGRFNKEIERILASGDAAEVDFRIVHKDGRVVYCEDRGQFFRDARGEILRMVGFLRDVTQRQIADEALRESQQRLSMAQKAGHVGAFDWSIRDSKVFWTTELEELYGLQAGTYEGTLEAWGARVVQADRIRVEQQIEQCIEERRQDLQYEFRAVLPDGQHRWLAGHARFTYTTNGKPVRMIGVNVDIHERKTAEQALKLSEQRLQLAVAIAQMGTFELCVKTDELLVNDIFRSMYGWESSDAVTQEKILVQCHPDDFKMVKQSIDHVLDPEGSREFEVEHRIYKADGALRWIRVRGRGLTEWVDGQKKVTKLVGTSIDVTQAKELEKVLLESEEKFRTLADNISQLAWMTDGRGEALWYNLRYLTYTGATPEQLGGKGWLSFLHPDHANCVVEKYAQSIQNGEPWEETFLLRGVDGEYCWFLSRAMPIRNSDGNVIRWFGTNTDITEQREAEMAIRDREEQLEELNAALAAARDDALAASAAKSTFLATMSHELRTPLNAVIGYAELLKEAAEQGGAIPNLVSDLEHISSSGHHLLTIISDILDFSKIEAGRMELAHEIIDVHRVMNEAAAAVAPQSAARGNRMLVCGPAESVAIHGDYTRLKQVLINLMGNAAKFTNNGEIHLEAEVQQSSYAETISNNDGPQAPERVVFRVTDTGIGIAKEDIPLLFESFRQLDASQTRRHGGTGLGLAITKRLVELMGGNVSLQSEIGKGTTFTVELPRN